MPFAEINKDRIHYIVRGKGKPLLFLHGLFYDVTCYPHLIARLSKDHKVYAIDMPTHGKSGHPKKSMSIDSLTGIVKGLCDILEIKRPTICAHSAGALAAIGFASRYDTEKLILLNPAGVRFFDSRKDFYSVVMKKHIITNFLENPMRTPILHMKGFRNFVRSHRDEFFLEFFDKMIETDLSEQMKKVRCPVTLIWGRKDVVLPISFSEQYAQNFRDCQLITVNAGHDWPILSPEEIDEYF